MGKATFDDVLEQALELAPEEQIRLAEQLTESANQISMFRQQDALENALSDAEIADLLRSEPMSGAEIVAAGLTGTWSDLGIEDGAEWVNTRKKNRKERNKW